MRYLEVAHIILTLVLWTQTLSYVHIWLQERLENTVYGWAVCTNTVKPLRTDRDREIDSLPHYERKIDIQKKILSSNNQIYYFGTDILESILAMSIFFNFINSILFHSVIREFTRNGAAGENGYAINRKVFIHRILHN